MRLVDTLISFDNSAGVIEANVSADCILVNSDGSLDEAALVELLAQGYAVIKGYADRLQGEQISEGYLVGVRKLLVSGLARAGEQLRIDIRTIGSFEGFAVAEGEITRGSETIANGTFKLWIVDAGRTA
jgi:predicted hotdog family 3-hydroxylacyl-ACP dehydratase